MAAVARTSQTKIERRSEAGRSAKSGPFQHVAKTAGSPKGQAMGLQAAAQAADVLLDGIVGQDVIERCK